MNVIYNFSNQSIIEPIVFGKSNANDIVGLDSSFWILDKVFVNTPDYNPKTENAIESWTVDLENLQYVQTWTIAAIPPQPDWDGFLTPFYVPGVGGIYDSIATSVQASTPMAQEHWANIRMGLINSSIRTPEWLYSSWEYLKLLLSENENPLSAETIAVAETLMQRYNVLP
jgi:hypothetical protein